MQLQFLAPAEFFFKSSLTVAVFDPGEIIIFYDIQFFPLCGGHGMREGFSRRIGVAWKKHLSAGTDDRSTKKCSVNTRILVTYSATFSSSKFY